MHAEFEVHILNTEGIAKAQAIAESFDRLLAEIEPLMPVSSRERSIVVTKLEEASFFAKKAMAKLSENQK